jgi:beta-fructofuranosidase
LIQWNGQYHLFYQYNPYGPLWGNIHWGHAVSDDLVYWEDLPIALAPTLNAPDKDGCWTGCAVNDNGTPTLIYTGVKPEVQCLATSSDGLLNWEKYRHPIIAEQPADMDLVGFRDPFVWQDADDWYMALGAGIKDIGGAILLYRSPDLRRWDYLGPMLIGDKTQTGEMWECPNFFPLGNKHILFVSVIPRAYTLYFIGTYKNHKFVPERQGRLDFGRYFYAPQAFLDQQNRRIMFGWVWDGCNDEALQAAGWAGMQSVPRLLWLDEDATLQMAPVPELHKLRARHHYYKDLAVTPASTKLISDVQGDNLELVAEFEPDISGQAGLIVRCTPDGKEQTRIVYQWATQYLSIDRQRTSLNPNVDSDSYGGRVELRPGERLKLHVFLDHSVIEVFANERACLTSRIYPSRSDSLGVDVFAQGREAKLRSLDVWELKSIWD